MVLMSNNNVTLDRTSHVCGYRLKHFRKLLGWTQEELARRSGYCDRLIRKAEGGGSLSTEAIGNIAQSLCCNGIRVRFEDLVSSPKETVHRFLDALRCDGIDIDVIEQLATDQVLVESKGGASVPFAGEWKGYDGMLFWLETFCEAIVPDSIDKHAVIAVDGDIAFIQTLVCFRLPSKVSPPIDLYLRMEFDCNLVLSIVLNADSVAIEEFFSIAEKHAEFAASEIPNSFGHLRHARLSQPPL